MIITHHAPLPERAAVRQAIADRRHQRTTGAMRPDNMYLSNTPLPKLDPFTNRPKVAKTPKGETVMKIEATERETVQGGRGRTAGVNPFLAGINQLNTGKVIVVELDHTGETPDLKAGTVLDQIRAAAKTIGRGVQSKITAESETASTFEFKLIEPQTRNMTDEQKAAANAKRLATLEAKKNAPTVAVATPADTKAKGKK